MHLSAAPALADQQQQHIRRRQAGKTTKGVAVGLGVGSKPADQAVNLNMVLSSTLTTAAGKAASIEI